MLLGKIMEGGGGGGDSVNYQTIVKISLAGQPTYFRSTDRFQYRHAEEWSGDLGPLHVNLY